MPYDIRDREGGYKVCKKGTRKCYSNDPLPLNRAKRQLKALYASEADMEGGGFFQNLLKRAFTGISDMIVRPRGFDPSKHTQGWPRRPIDMPPLHALSQMVASTYKEGDPQIQGYTLLYKTPTVSFFQVDRKKNVIIIALRGTAFSDLNDISADLGIVRTIVQDANTARNVRNSQRYSSDVNTIKNFQSNRARYMPKTTPYQYQSKMVYYAVGHSLSGAMIDELLEDGLVSSAVSFNPAIERINFGKDNDNHRVYVSCDVLYNLLGKFITNGNLEVVEKENPAGVDAGPIDASKGTITCHNINTVIPLMSGKGIENKISNEYKPMSFQDLMNKPSLFRERFFRPIGRLRECENILSQPVTQDVGPNSGRERQRRAYEKCLRGESDEPARPIRRDIALKGSGFLDTLVGNLGRSLADQASQGNILGRIGKTISEGREQRKREQDEEWNKLVGRIGIPNPMKLFGGNEEELVKTGYKLPTGDEIEEGFYGKKLEDAPSKFNQRGKMRLFGRGACGGKRQLNPNEKFTVYQDLKQQIDERNRERERERQRPDVQEFLQGRERERQAFRERQRQARLEGDRAREQYQARLAAMTPEQRAALEDQYALESDDDAMTSAQRAALEKRQRKKDR